MRYAIPASRHRTDGTVERSRFICTVSAAMSAAEAQAFVREVDAEFPDATHNCWAYVIGAPGSTDRIGMSDDGEPHGTAGRPMLTVLQHSGVGDIAAVVTRYYGGTKLGTGGLVKAYGGAVQSALATLPRRQRIDYVDLVVTAGYADLGALKLLWPLHEIEIVREEFGADVRFETRVPEESLASARRAILDATRGSAVFGL